MLKNQQIFKFEHPDISVLTSKYSNEGLEREVYWCKTYHVLTALTEGDGVQSRPVLVVAFLALKHGQISTNNALARGCNKQSTSVTVPSLNTLPTGKSCNKE